MATVATIVLAMLVGAVAVLGGVIAGGRAARRLVEASRARLASTSRRSLLALAAGDDDPALLETLAGLPPATWRAVEPTAVALLGKVRGEAYAALVSVLERRGMADRALRDVHRWGAIRRARAAEVLGSLRRRDAVPPLRHLLTDPDPDVRMVAVRALGRIGDADSATPLLQALVGPRPIPPQLIAQALMGLGAPAQPLVEAGLGHPDELVRATAAEVLGLVGAISATARLVRALREDASLEVRLRAARALGKLGIGSALPPLLDVQVVVVGGLAQAPHVEGLVDDEHSQPVTGVKQGGRGRIVRATQGVEAGRLHQLDLAFLGPVVAGGAQEAMVVVHIAALELHRHAVQAEAVGGVDRDRADAEAGGLAVHYRAVEEHLAVEGVQVGGVHRPELGVGDGKLLAGGKSGVCGQVQRGLVLGDGGAVDPRTVYFGVVWSSK